MSELALKRDYLVHELVGATSFGDAYQIIDANSEKLLGKAVERVSAFSRFARLFLDKSFLPIKIDLISTENDSPSLTIERPVSIKTSVFGDEFWVRNADGKVLCIIRHRFSLFNAKIEVCDEKNITLGIIKGGWRNRKFEFRDQNGNMISTINHQFAGLAREFFTTADDYRVKIFGDSSMSLISLASAICIDIMFHEG